MPPFFKSQLNSASNVLKLLHMNLTGIERRESFNRKRYIYAEAIRMARDHLEHFYLLARTLTNPCHQEQELDPNEE